MHSEWNKQCIPERKLYLNASVVIKRWAGFADSIATTALHYRLVSSTKRTGGGRTRWQWFIYNAMQWSLLQCSVLKCTCKDCFVVPNWRFTICDVKTMLAVIFIVLFFNGFLFLLAVLHGLSRISPDPEGISAKYHSNWSNSF